MVRIYSTVLRSVSSFFLFFSPVPYSQQEERARTKAKRETAKVIFSGIADVMSWHFFLYNSILDNSLA